MAVHVRAYGVSDRGSVIRCIEALQQYEASIDAAGHIRLTDGYGEMVMKQHEADMDKGRGKIFVAADGGDVVGYISGFLREQTAEQLLGSHPVKEGFVIGLFVDTAYRGEKTGQKLMAAMEEWCRDHGATHMRLWVLARNAPARGVYRQLGYEERLMELEKKLF